jgi:uncharacterized protein YbgA (DUF1722 family)
MTRIAFTSLIAILLTLNLAGFFSSDFNSKQKKELLEEVSYFGSQVRSRNHILTELEGGAAI